MAKTARMRFFVGILKGDSGDREVFKASWNPGCSIFSDKYIACIGPFRTKRGAVFMAKYGKGNPHLQTVSDAERIAKECADDWYGDMN